MNLNEEKFLQDDILKWPDSCMLYAKHEIRQTVICHVKGEAQRLFQQWRKNEKMDFRPTALS